MNGWPQGYTVEGWKEGVDETSVRQAYGPRLEPVRRRELIIILIALSCFLFAGHLANAQSLDCGDLPLVAEEDLRAEIQGKAQVLSRYLGDADLSGRIEKSRKEIFSKYKNANERSDAFFEYQVCILLSQDKSLSPLQKIEEPKKIHREFSRLVSEMQNKAARTLSYWNESRYIFKECDLQAALEDSDTTDEAEGFSKVSMLLHRCAERFRSLPISNVDEQLVDMITTHSESMDEVADFFMKLVPLVREENWYRSVNQRLPRSFANKKQSVMEEMQIINGKTGDSSIDKRLNALRVKLVQKYGFDFSPF